MGQCCTYSVVRCYHCCCPLLAWRQVEEQWAQGLGWSSAQNHSKHRVWPRHAAERLKGNAQFRRRLSGGPSSYMQTTLKYHTHTYTHKLNYTTANTSACNDSEKSVYYSEQPTRPKKAEGQGSLPRTHKKVRLYTCTDARIHTADYSQQ